MNEKAMKRGRNQIILLGVAACVVVLLVTAGVWWLLAPETFWQKAAGLACFCVTGLPGIALIIGFTVHLCHEWEKSCTQAMKDQG